MAPEIAQLNCLNNIIIETSRRRRSRCTIRGSDQSCTRADQISYNLISKRSYMAIVVFKVSIGKCNQWTIETLLIIETPYADHIRVAKQAQQSVANYLNLLHTVWICYTLFQSVVHSFKQLHTVCICCTLFQTVAHCLNLLHTVSICCTVFESVAHSLNLLHTVWICYTPFESVAYCLNLLHTVSNSCTQFEYVAHCFKQLH